MQTLTVEYVVSGALDGTTPSPPLEAAEILDSGIRRFTVENLGLVDPSFDGEVGSAGDRFAYYLILSSPTAPVGGEVAILSEGVMYVAIANPVDELTYLPGCFIVPQNNLIRFNGYDTGGDPTPIVVRFQIVAPEDEVAYALFLQSCCCGGCADPPQIFTVTWPNAPTCITCEDSASGRTITVTGANFTSTTTVEIFNTGTDSCANNQASISDVTIVSETELTFIVACVDDMVDCPFGIRIFNGPNCSTELSDAFCLNTSA